MTDRKQLADEIEREIGNQPSDEVPSLLMTHAGWVNIIAALRSQDEALALLRAVLSCGLNEEPAGNGVVLSKQEKLAGQLTMDINAYLLAAADRAGGGK